MSFFEDATEDSDDEEATFGGPDQFESGYPESPVLIIDGLAAMLSCKKKEKKTLLKQHMVAKSRCIIVQW